jgi:hypothetical protein
MGAVLFEFLKPIPVSPGAVSRRLWLDDGAAAVVAAAVATDARP